MFSVAFEKKIYIFKLSFKYTILDKLLILILEKTSVIYEILKRTSHI